MRAYFLQPKGPFQVGGGALGGSLPRSDTFSAAVVSLWRHVDRSADIDEVASSPPFLLSSALPWVELPDQERALFYPVPQRLLAKSIAEHPERRKSLKKIAYATAEALEELLGEGSLEPSELDRLGGGALLTHLPRGTLGEATAYCVRSSRLRVAIDRLGDRPLEGQLFESMAGRFSRGAGFAVIAEVSPDSTATFEAVLNLLGSEGLGADRTSGQGGFEVADVQPFHGPALGEGGRLLLSLYHPTRQEVEAGVLDQGDYALLERGGWVTAPGAGTLRRRPVRMLAEGSVVSGLNGDRMGDLVEVLAPDPVLGLSFPVSRDGRALWLPIRGEGGAG